MKENVHNTQKHPRGSSPPENVEEIYRSWLQRPGVARDGEAEKTPTVPNTDETSNDAAGATPEKPAGPARQ